MGNINHINIYIIIICLYICVYNKNCRNTNINIYAKGTKILCINYLYNGSP